MAFWDIAASGLLNLGAGLFTNDSNRKQNEAALRQAQGQFDSQMDESIQRRVADAEKAGIHPLFALGGSVGSSPTIQAGAGRDVAPSVRGRQTMGAAQKAALEGQLKLSEAQAAYYNSLAAKTEQDRVSSNDGQIAEIPATAYAPKRPSQDYMAQMQKHRHIAPLYKYYKDDATGRNVRLFNPEAGLDEIGQAYALGPLTENNASSWLEKASRSLARSSLEYKRIRQQLTKKISDYFKNRKSTPPPRRR